MELRRALEQAIEAGVAPSQTYGVLMQRRFGLGITHPVTLQDLSAQANCTRERIRQVEQRLMRRISAYWPDTAWLNAEILRVGRTRAALSQVLVNALGPDIWPNGIERLAQAAGQPLPPCGFDRVAEALGLNATEVWQFLELKSMRKLRAADVRNWMLPEEAPNHEEAPSWALGVLVDFLEQGGSRENALTEAKLPDDLEALPQPEQIRQVMLRAGFTRAEMMDAMQVQRSQFDRWLWPADNPVRMTPSMKARLASIARMAGERPRPRNRRLGANKPHSVDGIPGCARRSIARESGTVISLHRVAQSELYSDYDGPWVLVCEDHRYLVTVDSFAEGMRASSRPTQWCPECAAKPPHTAEPK